jgi:hypothetical protein
VPPQAHQAEARRHVFFQPAAATLAPDDSTPVVAEAVLSGLNAHRTKSNSTKLLKST